MWLLVSVPLPHGEVGWSAVWDCGISWSCSLTFLEKKICAPHNLVLRGCSLNSRKQTPFIGVFRFQVVYVIPSPATPMLFIYVIYETCHMMFMCIIYFKSENIDLALPF